MSNFEKTFGFKPSNVQGMGKHEQTLVDNRLQALASDFKIYADQQTIGLTSAPEANTPEHLGRHEEMLKRNAFAVKRAKQAFWRAHKLAKNNRYTVAKSYSDYLWPGGSRASY